MKTTTWVKPSGQEITINDRPQNIEYAKKLGWKLKEGEQEKVSAAPGDKARGEKPAPAKKPAPGKKGKGVKMAIPRGTGTTLYKRLKGEIESDLFPDELVAKKLQDGWYKTKEEAGDAPPDKPEGN